MDEENVRRRSSDPKRRSALYKIRAPVRGYSKADLPRNSAFSDHRDEQKVGGKGGKGRIFDPPPLKASVGNIFPEIEDKQMLPRPPKKQTSQYKKNMSTITGSVNVISGEWRGGGDSGSVRRAYAKRDIYVVMPRARPEFPDLSFSRKDFEGIECPHEDPLVITPVIANFEIWHVATPLVGFTCDSVIPLGMNYIMVNMKKHPQQATKMVDFTIVDMSEGAYNGIIVQPSLS
ncbi:hypothetical protein LIER_27203 [Lithospermum erythrorhizon]|uniref:Uncharacterized protein n=1 Tax=Lithospermum erythrorhizon TaxID=34254 RepID=A0AAV3RCR9_LITER